MGGFGSGQRWNSKATTSNYGQLDVRDWQREGLLVVGRSFLCWPWDVEVIATMKRDEPNWDWAFGITKIRSAEVSGAGSIKHQ